MHQHFTSGGDTATWLRIDRRGSQQELGHVSGVRSGSYIRFTAYYYPETYDVVLTYDELSETYKTAADADGPKVEVAYYTSGESKAFFYGAWVEAGSSYSFYAPLLLEENEPGNLPG